MRLMKANPMRRWIAVVVGGAALPAVAVTAASAQDTGTTSMFPARTYFASPLAAPREPGFSISLFHTDIFARPDGGERTPLVGDDLDEEWQMTAGLGGVLPLWRVAAWKGGGMTVAVQTGVFGRFRAERITNDLVASDWIVALPVDARLGAFEARLRLVHWSAHIGDELMETTSAERLDFGHEALDLFAGYRTGVGRVYAGAAWVMRSPLERESTLPETFTDDATLQVGADASWSPWGSSNSGLVAGLDVFWADRTSWRDRVSTLFGVEKSGRGPTGRLALHYSTGPSPLGQFFLTEETIWGVVVELEL